MVEVTVQLVLARKFSISVRNIISELVYISKNVTTCWNVDNYDEIAFNHGSIYNAYNYVVNIALILPSLICILVTIIICIA